MVTSTKHKVLLPCFLPIVSSFYIHTSLGTSDMNSTWNRLAERGLARRDLRTLFSWPAKEDQPALPDLPPEPAQHPHCPYFYLWLGTLAGVHTCLAGLQNKEADLKYCLWHKQSSPEMPEMLDRKNVNNKDIKNVSNDINKLLSGNGSLMGSQELLGTSCPNFLKILAAYVNQNSEKTGPAREEPAQTTLANFVPEAGVTIPATSPPKPSKIDIHPRENGGFRRFFKSAGVHNASLRYHNATFPSVTERNEPPVVYLPDDLPVDDDFDESILNSPKQLIEVTPPYPIGLLQSMIDVLSAFFDKSPKTHAQVALQCTSGKTVATESPETSCLNYKFTKRRGTTTSVTVRSAPPNTEGITSTTPAKLTISLQRNDFDLGRIVFNASELWASVPTEKITYGVSRNPSMTTKMEQESTSSIVTQPNVTFMQYPFPIMNDINMYGTNTSKWFYKFCTECININSTMALGALNLSREPNSFNLPTPKSRMNFFPNFKQKKSPKNFVNGQALNNSRIEETHIVAQDIKRKTTPYYSIWGIMGFQHRTKAQPDSLVVLSLTDTNLSTPNLVPVGIPENPTVPVTLEKVTIAPSTSSTGKKERNPFTTERDELLGTKRDEQTEEFTNFKSQGDYNTNRVLPEGMFNQLEREHLAQRNKYLNYNFDPLDERRDRTEKTLAPLHLNNSQIELVVYDIPTIPSSVTQSNNSFLRRIKHSMVRRCAEAF